MKYITTTQLRTKSKELVDALRDGDSVTLIHRSEVIGTVAPADASTAKKFNAERYGQALRGFTTDIPGSLEERDKLYRQAMEEKHGPPLS